MSKSVNKSIRKEQSDKRKTKKAARNAKCDWSE